ncbi:MAG: ribosomal RNA small subunit methyltransferase A [Spiroplasma poulsonii]|uniref:Ribosomal RNA small subunit methyltransferase A n=1 Tax=Spiroplasma poulsonii TaxID=2138 RepID=A0A2P6FG68_9MOLU|nr:16S rRNA (adenine(1518)-N(6)/adenine(1519)-N(6))-dimethyltransferase RsmA [Spiroplasma poulsonii]KAF0849962.1 Ribosomal RNA small subunit methyltransferase A [Spiroplasma poulsonii]MBW1241788.1 ribosomal RNA small subunit methyltransferase A [Spiroplasma poulsonii]PQM32456.1 Ribosomal RNA small subunit methyltransferase A [Spiroplasma poulsonii]PWF95122.1 Ribosomal RNA small subunit methyltransferase A [Spiroplasma poulsonii]PWF97915.1 Ribosomal RNA small subunit methyltransferase A [Spirop
MKKQNQEMWAEGIIAKKSKGQNFLTNSYFINKIVNSVFEFPKTNILEIGPGIGALTNEILLKANKFVCVEIDPDLVKYLTVKFQNQNFKIIEADILTLDLETLFATEFPDNNPINIISNIPYYITSPIIFKLLKIKNPKVKEVVLMMQKEVGDRIMAQPNSRAYNNLSIVCQLYSDIEKVCLVGRNNFVPVPKVDSVVLKFKLNRKYPDLKNEEDFIVFIRAMFATKRKTILNNLATILHNKTLAQNILLKLNYSLTLRSERLTLNDFYLLYNEVKQNEKEGQ